MKELTLTDIQKEVDAWIKTVGVRYFSELTNMAILTEEVGELARIMARTYGEQSLRKDETTHSLADEINDIFFVLVCIANQTGVDLTTAFLDGMQKRNLRDRDRHNQNPKLYS